MTQTANDRLAAHPSSRRHPLAPLTLDETAAACRIALDGAPPGTLLVFCELVEPAKDVVLGWDGAPVPRLARCVLYHPEPIHPSAPPTLKPHQPRTSLAPRWSRCRWTTRPSSTRVPVPGVQPAVMFAEYTANGEQVKADPGFQAALARRGITDVSQIQVDAWPAATWASTSTAPGAGWPGLWPTCWTDPGCNPYARPIENLVAVLDRDTGEVVELIDGDVVPVPKDPGRYDAASMPHLRELAPLQILQPDGPGFTVQDGLLRWGPWQLRVSMHPIEGLVLHEVCYIEGDRVGRSCTGPAWPRWSCPTAPPPSTTGGRAPSTRARSGWARRPTRSPWAATAWARSSTWTRSRSTRTAPPARCRRPSACTKRTTASCGSTRTSATASPRSAGPGGWSISFIATVGNYEYGFFWYFYLDGTIQAEVKLTGIIQTQAVAPGDRVPYASPVTPELAGPPPAPVQLPPGHLPSTARRTRSTRSTRSGTAGPDNPHGNAFTARRRCWRPSSAPSGWPPPSTPGTGRSSTTIWSTPAASPSRYKLVPQPSAPLLAHPDAAITAPGRVRHQHLWVTPPHPDEQRPAGDFPTSTRAVPDSPPGSRPTGRWSTPTWCSGTRSAPPTLPRQRTSRSCRCEYVGFTLKPAGFFDRNPAIDLAPADGDHCHS